ncbi:hypothetical protein ACOMHN_056459 [Nucella lapillus]
MDAEAGATGSKPAATLCGAPVVKVLVLGSLVGTFGLLGALAGLHFSGHLGSSQGQGSEATSPTGAMASGANPVRGDNNQKQVNNVASGNAMATAALATSDSLEDAIQDVADDIHKILDNAAADVPDNPDGPLLSTDLDLGDLSDLSDPLSKESDFGLGDSAESFGDLSNSMDLQDLSDGGLAGDMSDSLADSGEGLGDFGGGGFFGDSSDSVEGMGGDGFLGGFGDGMGDLGGDLGDGLGSAMAMSSMMNNNNNNNANRPPQNAQRPSQQQNVNPFGLFVLTDGFDFSKKR